MLVKDAALQERHETLRLVEKQRDANLKWATAQFKDSYVIGDPDSDPTNFLQRLGRVLQDWQVEQKLARLCPNLVFEDVPAVNGGPSTKKYMYEVQGDKRRLLMLYEKGPIPERSWMQGVYKESIAPEVFAGDKPFHIDRKDLTPHEVRPHEFDEQGNLKTLGGVDWDPTVPIVGMKRELIPWAERIRGWRTMLVILVHAGCITPTQAEAEFGADNTPEWAAHMGRRAKTRPW